MHRSLSLLATAVLALALAGATASANRLGINRQGFLVAFRPMTGFASFLRCNVTLAGRLHGTSFTKTLNVLAGVVTSAQFTECAEGTTALVLRETLPWHVRYCGFTGALPAITGVTLCVVGLSFSLRIGEATCLLRTTAETPLRMTAQLTSGRVTSVVVDERSTITPTGTGICGFFGPVRLIGTGAASDESLTESLRFSLT